MMEKPCPEPSDQAAPDSASDGLKVSRRITSSSSGRSHRIAMRNAIPPCRGEESHVSSATASKFCQIDEPFPCTDAIVRYAALEYAPVEEVFNAGAMLQALELGFGRQQH